MIFQFFKTLITLSFLLMIAAGCGGGGGSGDDSTDTNLVINDSDDDQDVDDEIADLDDEIADNSVDDSEEEDTAEETTDPVVSFNVANAAAIVINSKVLDEVTAANLNSSSTKSLVTANNKTALATSSTATSGSTNLLALDNLGNLSLAIATDYDLQVMYTVAAPNGEDLYVALDNGLEWWSQGSAGCSDCDYTEYLIEQNCALFVVNIMDNSFECASEGLFVQGMNEDYLKMLSGNQKPIQFDAEGNAYFLATSFTIESDTFCDISGGFNDDSSDDTPTTDDTSAVDDEVPHAENCQIISYLDEENTVWSPRLYKYTPGGSAVALTESSTDIDYFVVQSNGDVIFQSTTETASSLNLLQSGTISSLSNSDWSVEFFTTDTGNTALFGQAELSAATNGVRFGRSNGSGIDSASLPTSLFGDAGDWGDPKPRRIIQGDDGKVYLVVEGGRAEVTASDGWLPTLDVYQMLPYSSSPIVSIDMEEDGDWWDLMNNTPFQIVNGILYYVAATTSEDLDADVIHAVKLSDGEDSILLSPASAADRHYEIYSWRLSNDTLLFTAADNTNDVIVTGQIDTNAIANAVNSNALDNAVSIVNTAADIGSTAQLQDIEFLGMPNPAVDSTTAPSVASLNHASNNPYTIAINFDQMMDQDSVNNGVSLVDSGDDDVRCMKVWQGNSLHLIPDLDVNVSGDALSDMDGSTPLTSGETYSLQFGSDIEGANGQTLSNTADSSVEVD